MISIFMMLFLIKTKVVPLRFFSKLMFSILNQKIVHFERNVRLSTTLVLVENTSFQWYYRVKSISSILIKFTLVIEYAMFFIKNTQKKTVVKLTEQP